MTPVKKLCFCFSARHFAEQVNNIQNIGLAVGIHIRDAPQSLIIPITQHALHKTHEIYRIIHAIFRQISRKASAIGTNTILIDMAGGHFRQHPDLISVFIAFCSAILAEIETSVQPPVHF